jgi:hypothetical protein
MADTELKIVAGRVSKEGVKISGEGFDSTGHSGGRFQITFRPAFNSLYGASATLVGFDKGPNWTTDNCFIYDITNGSISVVTGDGRGNHVDQAFSFVVVGV